MLSKATPGRDRIRTRIRIRIRLRTRMGLKVDDDDEEFRDGSRTLSGKSSPGS